MKSYIQLFTAIYLVLALTACQKFLDVSPKDDVSDEQTITDKASAETAIRGMYRSLADNGYYGSSFQSNSYLQGDNLDWTDSRTVSLQFLQHNVRPDNDEVQTVWTAIYETVNRANYAIAKIPGVQDPLFPQSERDQLLGEAYFVRALAYFDLGRTWGGVQLVLEPTESIAASKDLTRSSQADTYAQVLKDLEAAEPLLPLTTNRVRATRKTVWALRARLHLYRGEWAAANEYADKLTTDITNYPLQSPYNSFFANNAVGTPESVLETSYSANNTNAHRSQWQPPANGGTRRWAPNAAFLALVNDPAIGGNRSAMVAQTAQGQWYGNMYYRSPATDPAYVIRIAELFLISAEAQAQLNNLDSARINLNAVRNRAGLAPTTATTQQNILLAIENERRLEFAFEPHRWYDLVRTGRAAAVTGVTDVNKYVLPIPIQELSVDKSLVQNPGYN
ncbi:RagB/SusD domain-containing protein [Chitinophaga costaii]|uniref:RagB/SusD domain-containing protein n=1 Tax=Chitinophaga costaii TaxID=1335309 RepID=A0A1C3Z199_9BACT|nr:RagB/SusD family nutrient uptake outer membrane protein [Chitinophaga costaii]PUZ30192.1 RagB/SusD family nutrient uptake outer membrane protein [Chitinophaga costaii]SCB76167.1 RagB/SusD domain-containing protein [Chitinophaga costaii]